MPPFYYVCRKQTVNRFDVNESRGELMEEKGIYFCLVYCSLSVSFLCNTICNEMPDNLVRGRINADVVFKEGEQL